MSSEPIRRSGTADTVAGFLSALAIFFGAIGLVYRPVRLTLPAMLIALIAAGIGGRHQKLAMVAVMISIACFVLGMTIAVAARHPLW